MNDLIFGLIIFCFVMFILIEVILLGLFHRIAETNEWIADIKIKKDKEIYELRRRVAILENDELKISYNDVLKSSDENKQL